MLVNLRSFGNHIVNEDHLAATSVIGGCKQHTVACNARDSCGLEVCDNDYLLTNKLLGLVLTLDAGNDNSFLTAHTVDYRGFTGIRLSYYNSIYTFF